MVNLLNLFSFRRENKKAGAAKNEDAIIPLEEIEVGTEIISPIVGEGDKNNSQLERIIMVEQETIKRFPDIKISTTAPILVWYNHSLQILQDWRVKGEIQINTAKKVQPQELQKVYSVLADMLASAPDTEMFIRLSPQILFYRGYYFNSYINKLSQILDSTRARFGYDVPKEFDWKRSPSSFAALDGLAKLESTLTDFDRDYPEIEISKSTTAPIPVWYNSSLQILQDWRVKGEIQINTAKKVQPQELQKVYSVLADMLASAPDTEMFIRLSPQILFYRGYYFNSYINKLSQILDSTRARFGYDVPKEFDWKRSPSSFAALDGLAKLESTLTDFDRDYPEIEISKLREALGVYAGKSMLLLGVWTEYQKITIRRYLPPSTRLTFHSGRDMKGLIHNDFADYDVLVITGGVITHNIDQKLKFRYGNDFNKRVIYSINATNPERVLKIIAENSTRF